VLKEVTCQCGWQARGTEEEVIAQVVEHGRAVHAQELTAQDVMAIWRDASVESA
jgi:predicted small metal-binding protein